MSSRGPAMQPRMDTMASIRPVLYHDLADRVGEVKEHRNEAEVDIYLIN